MGVTGKHYCCGTSLHAFDIGGAFETPTVRELSNLVTPKPVFNWATVAELSGSIRIWSKRVPCADFQDRFPGPISRAETLGRYFGRAPASHYSLREVISSK